MATYDDLERSTDGASDVWLYKMWRGTRYWHYNSSDRDVVFEGDRYLSTAISNDGIKQKSEAVSDDFSIVVPSSIPIVGMFRGTPPLDMIRVELRQKHSTAPTDAPIMWRGFVSSVRYRDEITSELICNTQRASLARRGLRLSYERGCPHALYDQDCKVNPDLWGELAVVTELGGNSFTFDLAAEPVPPRWEGRFSGGFVEWAPTRFYKDRRAIQTHIDSERKCLMLNQTDGMFVGMQIVIYPGCRRIPADCKRFNNIPNYGGWQFLPGKSPFDGDPVF